MTKADIVKEISQETGIYRKDVARVVEAFLDTIKDMMKKGEHIEIRQFGTFKVKVREERTGRNPRTNKEVLVPQRAVPTFKFSREFKQYILKNLEPDTLKK